MLILSVFFLKTKLQNRQELRYSFEFTEYNPCLKIHRRIQAGDCVFWYYVLAFVIDRSRTRPEGMPKRNLFPQRSNTSENARRVFSVDDDVDELERDFHYLEGIKDGLKLKRTGTLSPSQEAVPHAKGSRFSIAEDNDHIIVQDGERQLVLDEEGSGYIDNEGNESLRGDLEQASVHSVESYTLRERQEAINETHPFGIRIWKPALYKKKRSVQQAADEDIHETKIRNISFAVQVTNFVWALTLGLFLCLLFSACGIIVLIFGLFTKSAFEYSSILFKLGYYLLWPFGKIIYLVSDAQYLMEDRDEGISPQLFYRWVTTYSNRLFFHQSQALPGRAGTGLQHPSYGSIPAEPVAGSDSSARRNSIVEEENVHLHYRLFGRGEWTIGRIAFYISFHLLVQPVVMILTLITWLLVFTIPMSNIMWNLMYHCRRHPLALYITTIKKAASNVATTPIEEIHGKNVLLCTFRCAGLHYYKFTVDGTNVIVMNLIMMVIFTIFDFFVVKETWKFDYWFTDESTIFMLCLISIVPLAFYIGQAVASISAQSSMGVAAVINAFFSTIVEIFLYCVAIQQSKGALVEGSLIGSILGAVLLLPGLSMCGGAIKRKTQRYNPASAGVSSAMLIFSMMVMFIPTVLREIYGEWEIVCDEQGERCHFMEPEVTFNKMYTQVLKPTAIFCAVVLFLQYAIGMLFTLRTHAKLIWQMPIAEQKESTQDQAPMSFTPSMSQMSIANVNNSMTFSNGKIDGNNSNGAGGHDAPNWSKTKSTCILLGATFLYAVIAEILVDCVDNVLKTFPSLSPKFLGLTVFALIPNTTEFLNAISFAMNGNVALSMEIGSAYALQVCLLQIPALVIFSIFYVMNKDITKISIRDQMFPLLFPRWDLIATVASVFMFTYLYAEGKSNYFKGSMLIFLYLVVILGFHFQATIDENFWTFLKVTLN